MSDTEQKTRDWAYRLWEEEGRPEGRENVHWERARELVAIEESQTLPLSGASRLEPQGEPLELVSTSHNLEDFPTVTDQGAGAPPHPLAGGQETLDLDAELSAGGTA